MCVREVSIFISIHIVLGFSFAAFWVFVVVLITSSVGVQVLFIFKMTFGYLKLCVCV